MKYKILLGGDLHKRMRDISTIKGYVDGCNRVQLDIMDKIKEHSITHFISLGDWFDKGYGSDVAAALTHTDIDREMSKLLNGNFYGVIGNHIRLRMDSNPELFLIQPHPTLRSRHRCIRSEQIIRTPKDLILNGVQFHFMHYNSQAESAFDYKATIDENCHYHIGLYHSEFIIPSDKLHDLGMYESSANGVISRALDKIDLAIVGHIHKPISPFNINKEDGTITTMYIPGSLTNTDAGMISRHDTVQMPLIEIDDTGAVTLSYLEQSLHTDKLIFMKKVNSDEVRDKLRSLRGNTKETLYGELEQTSFVGESSGFISLNSFMVQQGYKPRDRQLIRSVINSPDDINCLIDIFNKEDDI